MAGKVYQIDLRTSQDRSLLWKIEHLVESAGLGGVVKEQGLTAVKLHFGERGNTAFVRPILVRPIVDAVRKAGGKPFLTDANTLYVGTRGNAVDHLSTAILNGFDYSVAGRSAHHRRRDRRPGRHRRAHSPQTLQDRLHRIRHRKGRCARFRRPLQAPRSIRIRRGPSRTWAWEGLPGAEKWLSTPRWLLRLSQKNASAAVCAVISARTGPFPSSTAPRQNRGRTPGP